MTESIMDRGKQIDFGELSRELLKGMEKFYNDEFLDGKTDLENPLIDDLIRLENWDKIVFSEFGFNANLTGNIKMSKERKLISYHRTGRTEAFNAFTAQIQYAMMHPTTALKRLFGMD